MRSNLAPIETRDDFTEANLFSEASFKGSLSASETDEMQLC